jgi:uncharacterized protein (TIGR02145 family)
LKMKKNNLMNRFLVVSAILFMNATNISAQVTIGALEPPHAAAVLDLSQVNSQNLGLLMPRIELTALNSFSPLTGNEEDAVGMWVYNTAYNPAYDPAKAGSFCPGTYVWNGTGWNRTGEPCRISTSDVITPSISCSGVPPLRFMAYNLGADPTYDTPKKQMEYLATHPFSITDAHIYGGLFQWGRSDFTHGMTTDGTYIRYHGDGATNHATSGRTDTPVDGMFYYGYSNWRSTNDNSLWGNGEQFTAQDNDDEGGVPYNGKYYQNTDWKTPSNNPCPTGWRVPTEDEWERLGTYDCRPDLAGNNLTSISVDGIATGTGLTWVPVVCSYSTRQCKPDNSSWSANATSSGYAIYNTAEWNAANNYKSGTIGTKSLHDFAAPEPVLFISTAGCRSNATNAYGNLVNVGAYGSYGCSTYYSASHTFNLDFGRNNVDLNTYRPKAFGYSVRCVEQ